MLAFTLAARWTARALLHASGGPRPTIWSNRSIIVDINQSLAALKMEVGERR